MHAPTALIAAVVALAVGVSGCTQHRVATAMAKPPTLASTGLERCVLTPSRLRPLIVEWSAADRASLELRLKKGVVAVRYADCDLEVLHGCIVPAEYAYGGVTFKRDTVTIHDTDELYAQMPFGAEQLEAKLARAGALTVDMALVGAYVATRDRYASHELRGGCDGATHVLTAAQVGAFSFYTDAQAQVGATGVRREVLDVDGDMAACEAASPMDRAAPEHCGALLRLEFSPLIASPAMSKSRAGPPHVPVRSAGWNPDEVPAPVVDGFIGGGIGFVVGVGGLILMGQSLRWLDGEKRRGRMLNPHSPEFPGQLADVRRGQQRWEAVAVSSGVLGGLLVLAGSLVMIRAGFKLKRARTGADIARWRVAPNVGRTYGGLEMLMRF